MHAELPHNLDAERATLGSILLDREAIIAVAPYLTAPHFYGERHRRIYAAMLSLFERREPVDSKTLFYELKARGESEATGGIVYLSELVDAVPTAYHIAYYARRVVDAAERRALIRAAANIARLGYDEDRELGDAQAEAQTELTQAIQRARTNDLVTISSVMDDVWEDANRDEAPAIASGFYDLDELSGGFYDGELILIAARPSVGKTALALSLVYNVAGGRNPTPVQFYSCEMSRIQLGQRLAAMETGLDLRAIRQRRLEENERRKLADAAGRIAEWPVSVCDVAKQTPASLRALIMRAVMEQPRSLVIIDYVQLMESGKKTNNRVEEVGAISRQLKILARDANVPIIALSQLSREVEKRASQRPVLSDLRETGALEQDADVVMFIYRPGVENEDGTRARATETELIVEKARNGPVGTVQIQFQPETTRFVSSSKYKGVEGY